MSEPTIADVPDRPEVPADPVRSRRVAPFVALAVFLVMAAFVVVLVVATPPGSEGESAETPLLGNAAPAVVTTTLDGQPFDLSRRRGSWVVLNFFNTTCVPCIREHPELMQLDASQAALGTDGAELYTVVFDDADAPVRDFFDDNGGGWPILRDPDGTIAVAFGMAQVPETWIVDPAGIVVARYIGQITADRINGVLADLRQAR